MALSLYGQHHHPLKETPHGNRRITSLTTQIIRPPHPRQTREARSLPKTEEMCLQKGWNQLPGSYHWQWHRKNGPLKAERSSRLAETKNAHQDKTIPWFHQLLPVLHPQIFQNHTTPFEPYKKGYHMEFRRKTTMGIWGTKDMHVLQTSPTATRFWEEILSSGRCIFIRRGCHTLAGGKTPYTIISQTTKAHSTPHSILLSHIHTNQKKLRHLWKGTVSHDESPRTLETILGMDERTIHNHDRPHEPTILKITQEPQQKNSTMASRPARIWLRNTTHSRHSVAVAQAAYFRLFVIS